MIDATFKICIFGDGGVGKTTLTERFLLGLFSDETKLTLGASFYEKNLTVEGKLVNLQIWDFGGEVEFRNLLPGYIQGSSGAIFMYDLSRHLTLNNLKDWIVKLDEGISHTEIPILMVGGKLDLEHKRAVKKEDAEAFKNQFGFINNIECSSKTGENVDVVFETLTREMLVRAGI